MHSPQRMHFWRNFASGSDPGGRMSLEEARWEEGERRKKGMAIKPKREVKMSFLREMFTCLTSSAAGLKGKRIASVGQIEAQVKQ
jgi:hypothetical protein